MILTEKEIIFLTSVSRGRAPLGVTYTLPPETKRRQYIEETLQKLREKNLVDQEGSLTMDGACLVRLWEEYRNGNFHFAINKTFFMPVGDSYLMMLSKIEDKYMFQWIQSELLLLELMQQAEALRLGEKEPFRGKWTGIEDVELFLEQITESILIREYHKGKLQSEKAYVWKEKQGYLINLKKKRIRKLSVGYIRKQIYQMVMGETENEGRE